MRVVHSLPVGGFSAPDHVERVTAVRGTYEEARVCGRGGSYYARVHFISAAGVKSRLHGGMPRRVRDGRPYAPTLFFLDVQAGEMIV